MSTYATMQTRIADELARSDLTNQIKTAIQSAIKHYERRRFYFLETVDTFSTVADQEWYSGTVLTGSRDIANIVDIDSMTITIGTSAYEMDARDASWMDAVSGAAYTGDPTDYVYYRQQIRLFPIPSQVRTITVSYQRRLDALSDDDDTNAWMTEGEELIRVRAKIDLFVNVIRKSEEAAGLAPFLLEVERGMIRETEARSAGPVRAWG